MNKISKISKISSYDHDKIEPERLVRNDTYF
jgi:hypothetical protein